MRGDEASRARAHQGRMTAPQTPTDPQLDARIARQAERLLMQNLGDPSVLRERVDTLYGARGTGKAARVEQLAALVGALRTEPRSRPVTAAPTADEHNALAQDVADLFAAFNALRVLLR